MSVTPITKTDKGVPIVMGVGYGNVAQDKGTHRVSHGNGYRQISASPPATLSKVRFTVVDVYVMDDPSVQDEAASDEATQDIILHSFRNLFFLVVIINNSKGFNYNYFIFFNQRSFPKGTFKHIRHFSELKEI